MQIRREKSIFLDALDVESPKNREAFLKTACGDDQQLLSSVTQLLREHEREDVFIDHPLATFPEVESGVTELPLSPIEAPGSAVHLPGTKVGPYTLREQIGEGGFGLVFVADQESPVRRRVALKIVKPGMESREVLARFEVERQALAMMDHPNIARVFDAGMTAGGHPYFVMELVRGVPLCDFCENQKMDTKQRLELFVSICSAVQHAHQKGVIHRDLKPSNVLVTQLDGKPIAKVIDFGVAKAIGQSLTGKTIYTRFASMIGTPAYMSPEQAEMSAVDIDTRADIYSLGVLLYELLTGSTPFNRDRLDSAGFDELRRIIREEEPPRPSARLSTLDYELASTVSAARRSEPLGLTAQVKGDLDWIVMKAIEKDRNRRYSTAAAMAEDISHFLDNEPIEARPPSTFYRFSKFARRNKVTITTAFLVFASLIVGTITSVWQARVAIRETLAKELALNQSRSAEARANSLNDELEQFTDRLKQANVLLTSGRVHADSERWSEAHTDYTKATNLQPRYYHVWIERARFYTRLGLWDMAASDFAKALELDAPTDGPEWWGVPQLLWFVNQKKPYEELCRKIATQNLDDLQIGFMIRSRVVGVIHEQSAADLAAQAEALLARVQSKNEPSRDREQNRPRKRRSRRRGMSADSIPIGPSQFMTGWAQLRAGNYEQAIKNVNKSQEDERWSGKKIAYPILAMAYHQLGNEQDAKRALHDSQAFLDEQLNQTLQQSQLTPSLIWFDWIDFLISFRQAHIVVTGSTHLDDPRIHELKRRATIAIE